MWCLDIQTQGFETNPDVPGVCLDIRNNPSHPGYRNSTIGMHMIPMRYNISGLFPDTSSTVVNYPELLKMILLRTGNLNFRTILQYLIQMITGGKSVD